METNISDTPITDAAYFPPSSTMYSLAGEMKKLERQNVQLRAELLACYNRIPGIEQISELPDVILSGTVSNTIHAYGMMQEEKLKRLREVGAKMAELLECYSGFNETEEWACLTRSQYIRETRMATEVWAKVKGQP